MQIKAVLEDWGYPVIGNPKTFQRNILTILEEKIRLYGILNIKNNTRLQIVGTGTSGAMILGALATSNNFNTDYILLPKSSDDKRWKNISFSRDPIIIVDDHICSGHTLERIHYHLDRLEVDDMVVGLILNEWKSGGMMSDTFFEMNKSTITKLFPNAKFWIH